MRNQPVRVLDYAAGPPKSRLAVLALIFGIVGLPLLGLFGVGIVPAILAIICGASAMRRARRNPMVYGRYGVALTGVILGVCSTVLLPVLITIVLTALARSRELSNRMYCEFNLEDIGKAMVLYAENAEPPGTDPKPYPCLPGPATAGTYLPTSGPYTAPVTSKTTRADAGEELLAGKVPGTQGNVLATMWVTMLTWESSSPRSFVCKSDPFTTGPAPLTTPGGLYYAAFEKPTQVSYSIAYPWAFTGGTARPGGWWMDEIDANQPLACDMAPMTGTGRPARVTNPAAAPTNIKTWNSGNHRGEGQKVVYGDCHIEWHTSPVCGASLASGTDNIFTTNQTGPGTGGDGLAANGRIVIVRPATSSPYDVIMVPVRNLNTGGF